MALHNNILVVYQNLERQESLYPTYSQEYRNVLEKVSRMLELQIKVNQKVEVILIEIIRQG